MTDNRLSFVGPSANKSKAYYLCACGNTVERYRSNVESGKTRSCGCLRREVTIKRFTKHGMTDSPEFGVWSGMLERCSNPNCKSYPDYGGRGISVCDRWRESFANFYADMGPRPAGTYTIERVNVDGNYEPSNCCWMLKSEQSRNRRDSVYLTTSDGRSKHRLEWETETGIPWETTRRRIYYGWTVDEALFTPVVLKGQRCALKQHLGNQYDYL